MMKEFSYEKNKWDDSYKGAVFENKNSRMI